MKTFFKSGKIFIVSSFIVGDIIAADSFFSAMQQPPWSACFGANSAVTSLSAVDGSYIILSRIPIDPASFQSRHVPAKTMPMKVNNIIFVIQSDAKEAALTYLLAWIFSI